jgi:hypothetical protein
MDPTSGTCIEMGRRRRSDSMLFQKHSWLLLSFKNALAEIVDYLQQ